MDGPAKFSARSLEWGDPGSLAFSIPAPTAAADPMQSPRIDGERQHPCNGSCPGAAEVPAGTPGPNATGMESEVILLEANEDTRFYVTVDVLGVTLTGLLDSGSTRTIVNAVGLRKLQAAGLEIHYLENKSIRVANAQLSAIQGEVIVPFRVGRSVRVMTVLVVPELTNVLLLGMDFWRRFQLRVDFLKGMCEVGTVLVQEESAEESDPDTDSVLTSKQREELEEILETYRPLLDKEELGCAKGVVHHIDTGEAPPSKQTYNSLNPKMLAEAHKELDWRLEQGLVEPSDSPWCSPLLMLRKPNNGGWRWVVDLRKVNEKIKRPNAHQIPKINGSLMAVNRPTIISTLDIKDAYMQIRLDDESKPKTAFYVPGRGLYYQSQRYCPTKGANRAAI